MDTSKEPLRPLDLDPGRVLRAERPHYAIIDIGSNSVRLMVYDQLGRAPMPRFNEKSLCRLAEGLAQRGRSRPTDFAEPSKLRDGFALSPTRWASRGSTSPNGRLETIERPSPRSWRAATSPTCRVPAKSVGRAGRIGRHDLKPEMTPSVAYCASSAPDRMRTLSPVSAPIAAASAGPLAARRIASALRPDGDRGAAEGAGQARANGPHDQRHSFGRSRRDPRQSQAPGPNG